VNFRCPKTKHLMSLPVCAARAARREHGCITCKYPKQVEKDLKRLEGLAVGFDLNATGKNKRQPYYFRLDGKEVRLSRMVLQELHKRLGSILEAHK
jgi:hypothetical protein